MRIDSKEFTRLELVELEWMTGASAISSSSTSPALSNSEQQVETSLTLTSSMRTYLPNTHSITCPMFHKYNLGVTLSNEDMANKYIIVSGKETKPFVFAFTLGKIGHAVSMMFDESHMYFFDPNCGEYAVKRNNLAMFITKWISASAAAFGQTANPRISSFYILQFDRRPVVKFHRRARIAP